MPIELVIKAPNQKIEDHHLEAHLEWTVQRLKEALAEEYPSHPSVDEQKIIHAGRLLRDHLLLKDVLRQDGPMHVLHLVCRGDTAETANVCAPAASDVGVVGSLSSLGENRNHVPSSSTTLHYRGSSSRQNDNSRSSVRLPQIQVPAVGPGMPLNPEALAHQMAAMQQFYAQYMAQFMQHAQAVGGIGPYPDFTTLGAVGAQPHVDPIPPTENAAVDDAPAPGQNRNNNMRMNAQGGGPLFEEDDEVNRDWLDWFYIFSRAFVLFSIVYFYSSMGRFMVVMGITILIYMYQGGWFGVGRRADPRNVQQQQQQQNEQQRVEDPPTPPARTVPPEEANEEEIQEMEAVMDSTSIQDPHQPQTPAEVAPSNPSTFYTMWVFISSFFTSLIPEQPPPININ